MRMEREKESRGERMLCLTMVMWLVTRTRTPTKDKYRDTVGDDNNRHEYSL